MSCLSCFCLLQAYRFVSRFHEERKTKLTLILDNERWKQADVPAEFQHLVLHICNVGKLAVPKTKPDPGRGFIYLVQSAFPYGSSWFKKDIFFNANCPEV